MNVHGHIGRLSEAFLLWCRGGQCHRFLFLLFRLFPPVSALINTRALARVAFIPPSFKFLFILQTIVRGIQLPYFLAILLESLYFFSSPLLILLQLIVQGALHVDIILGHHHSKLELVPWPSSILCSNTCQFNQIFIFVFLWVMSLLPVRSRNMCNFHM